MAMAIGRRGFIGAATAASVLPRSAAAAPTGRPFLWGVATAAHQIEGNNVNSDYWLLESLPDSGFAEPSGDACDSWERWREDVALVAAMGLNAYRFSIEWARIEPEPGRFSRSVLDYYRGLCAACREAGIAPVVTFHHFTSPRWIAALGGWEDARVVDRFVRYCATAASALGDLVEYACTFNEPNAQVTSYVVAGGRQDPRETRIRAEAARALGSDRFCAFFQGDAFRVRDNILAAHPRAVAAIKAAIPKARVGMTLALQQLSAAPGGEGLLRRVRAEGRVPFFAAADNDDFVGVQSYNRDVFGPAGYLPTPADAERDASGQDASPGVLGAVVRDVHGACHAPIFVTENGINTRDDTQRIRHLRTSIAGLDAAIRDGVPVLGYLHWSLLDNFEWSSGYTPRFGLVAVDRYTFRRTPKPSAAAYRDLVRAHRG